MDTTTHRRARGFTLIETMVAVSIAGILSTLAYPSMSGALAKGRRSDALIALTKLQLAQERWRSDHHGYASADEIGLRATSDAGHYRIAIVSADDHGYALRATATGMQADDVRCRVLQVRVESAAIVRASGPDDAVANGAEDNRRCWGL
jgi:type IV pilus assembly protein PilE